MEKLDAQRYQLAPTPKNALVEKKTLVLDLDETLVHCEFKSNSAFQHETVLEVNHKQQVYTVYLRRRPYLTEFLQEMSQLFELVIFTAGYEAYCDKVLEYIDQDRVISNYLARTSCRFEDGNCLKDLTLIERPLDGLIFVDNNPNAFELQPENGLLIPSFLDDPNDDALKRLVPFLRFIATKHEIRPIYKWKKAYESHNGPIWPVTNVTLCAREEPDDEDNLSETHIVKEEQTDFELKHRKTQTLADQSTKITNNKRSHTLFAG